MRQTASAGLSDCQPFKDKVRAPGAVAHVSTFHARLIPSCTIVRSRLRAMLDIAQQSPTARRAELTLSRGESLQSSSTMLQ